MHSKAQFILTSRYMCLCTHLAQAKVWNSPFMHVYLHTTVVWTIMPVNARSVHHKHTCHEHMLYFAITLPLCCYTCIVWYTHMCMCTDTYFISNLQVYKELEWGLRRLIKSPCVFNNMQKAMYIMHLNMNMSLEMKESLATLCMTWPTKINYMSANYTKLYFH